MPRKHRVWFPGATYHITARGNRKDTIFYDTEDYETYLELLYVCKDRDQLELHAYCLMPNHIHLLMETKDTPPGKIIKYIHMNYAIAFNKKYNFTGHLFQGRYNAKLVLDDQYFLQASKYIHLNPTEANIVKNVGDYKWSSYRAYLGVEVPIVTTEKTLKHFQTSEDYIKFVLKKEETSTLYHFKALRDCPSLIKISHFQVVF
ncbi:transposase [Paucisalibacillus sp. EB02]|uniref:REP-associated tyrosine transposase n=1 Tax=Paucisalibacillus sp. EB02 TaxID=1347087 RepID=UPI0004BA86D2|nr:transposase [Paucisalibacillus sp. EB02]